MISIHARFARDMAQLPDGVEVIVCSGSEEATRDFDDFSTTEALIAQGREEASEVVRRYGLGRPGRPRHRGHGGLDLPVPVPTRQRDTPGTSSRRCPNGQVGGRSGRRRAVSRGSGWPSIHPEPGT